MAKQKVVTEMVEEQELDVGVATLETLSIAEYNRTRAWDQYVAGALAGRSTDGPSAVKVALELADLALAERDRRFPVESQS